MPHLQCTVSTPHGAFLAEQPIMALANSNTIICHLLPGPHLYTWVESSNVDKIALLKDKSAAAMVRIEPGLSAWESSEYSNIPRHLHSTVELRWHYGWIPIGYPNFEEDTICHVTQDHNRLHLIDALPVHSRESRIVRLACAFWKSVARQAGDPGRVRKKRRIRDSGTQANREALGKRREGLGQRPGGNTEAPDSSDATEVLNSSKLPWSLPDRQGHP